MEKEKIKENEEREENKEKKEKKEREEKKEKEENKEQKETKKNVIIKWIVAICVILGIICLLIMVVRSDGFKGKILKKGLAIKTFNEISYDENSVYINIETYEPLIKKQLWCIATENETAPSFDDEWQEIIDNKCNIKIDSNDKYIYIRDKKSVGEKIAISDYISCIAKIDINKDNMKLIKDERQKIDLTLRTIGNPDKTITYKSEDESIAKVENGEIIGVNDGTTKILFSDNYGNSGAINVEVTSLITLPQINNEKPFISNMQYTQEEAEILDEYLFYQIDEAGYKTRAGVVAAARFLSLEFKYRIPYFIENGRLTHFNHQRPYCDGEGRYFHRGLYLSVDKFDEIEKSVAGPAMWGAYIMEWSEDNGFVRNGLDCSGFVCWCLINGGFDELGDIGGGLSEGLPTLSDYGVSQRITMELLESGKVKAGDLIGYDGHIGIIIGINDEHVYVADTLYHSKGLWATEYTYKELVNSDFTHIYDYTEIYKEEGNYTNMW